MRASPPRSPWLPFDGRPRSRPVRVLSVARAAVLVALALSTSVSRGDAARAKPLPEIRVADIKTVLAAAKQPGARAVLVNVWASWCDPCREEMPDLVRFYRDNKARGLRLVLVSADAKKDKAAATKFLASAGVDFPSWLKTGDDMAFINAIDPQWEGTIPATVLYDGQGKQLHFWSGKVTYESLKAKLAAVLAMKPATPERKAP
jgi:thiol-disulfide isomerase/thioredoxin